MKKIKYFILPLLVVMITITSCKDEFLEAPATGALGESELAVFAGVDGLLTGTYSMLLGRSGFYSGSDNWFWGSVLGGDANKGTEPGDQGQVNEIQAYAAQPVNESVLQKYRACYEGVARANSTIKVLAQATNIADGDRTRIEAEARFLRAHYYFDLKRNFDDTPYVDETWDGASPVPNDQDLYTFIEDDMRFAWNNLPGTQSAAGRANKWAAGAYLGKILLFQNKAGEARTILNDVVANGVTASGEPYGLLDNYADAFRSLSDNSKESVFAVQAAAGTGSVENANAGMVLNFPNGGGPGGCCGFFQPSFELANSFRTGSDGLPLLDGSYNSDANKIQDDMRVGGSAEYDAALEYSKDDFVSVFQTANREMVYKSLTDMNMGNDPQSSASNWEFVWSEDDGPLDPRMDHSIGRKGIPYLDWGNHPGQPWVRQQSYGGAYAPKKFIYYQAGIGVENDASSWTPGYTTVNYNIIRFADVLLLAAEAEVEGGGSLGTAAGYVDRVRTRAQASLVLDDDGMPAANYNISTYGSFGSDAEARTAIRFERKLELSGEGHRKYDLVRWGVAAAELNAYLSHDGPLLNAPFQGASFSANNDEFLPIPQNEIDLLGQDVLSQNPGY